MILITMILRWIGIHERVMIIKLRDHHLHNVDNIFFDKDERRAASK